MDSGAASRNEEREQIRVGFAGESTVIRAQGIARKFWGRTRKEVVVE
jgi:hypothetical protein